MISDIFKSANKYFKFDQIVKDMDEYTMLTDNIFSRIKATDDPILDEAKQLLKRLTKRDLYTFVGEASYKVNDMKLFEVSIYKLNLIEIFSQKKKT